jgi:hypothetical protein
MNVDELFDRAHADPIGAWESAATVAGAPDLEFDPTASVALAVVLAGAAARAVELCAGDPQDPDFQRRFGAISAHASAAEMLARRDAGGLAAAAIARESMRYSWSAIELAMRTARSEELDAIGHAALRLLCDPLRPADERLDRALALERLSA